MKHTTQQTSIAKQRLGKYVLVATNTQATIDALLGNGCFLLGPPTGYTHITMILG
jgi:hypothetical protein